MGRSCTGTAYEWLNIVHLHQEIMRESFWIFGGRVVVVAREIPVTVRKMSRRVLLISVVQDIGEVGLITCVWSGDTGVFSPSPNCG